ncbi:MAG TPA: DUF2336 domain-containing protein [Xanthobacteraceae bacterium]|nr:DUF2336 domain-containing protein [Xanthobacteraceae bacterium]
MLSAPSLIEELETTLRRGTGAQRADILQRVTRLFLAGADAYNDRHVALFDEVMNRLIEAIERQALVRLSAELAPVPKAPTRVVQRLARDDDIEISRPVLQQSAVLSDEFLVELARSKSQQHLEAIAGRPQIAESVTDVLVERGNAAVTLKVTGNRGARFSRAAMLRVADRAKESPALAEAFAHRADIPPDVFDHLLSRATDIVRQRLLKHAAPEMRIRINQTLTEIAAQVTPPRPQGSGHSAVTLTHQDTQRLKSQLAEFARNGDRPSTVETLAALSKLPLESVRSLLRAEAEDGVLILCKAIGLGWPDTRHVLAVMLGVSDDDTGRKAAFDKFYNLSEETAQRVLRFVKSCKAVSKADLQRML